MSTFAFYFMIAAFAAFMGFVLGPRGASNKRPVLGGGIAVLCYVIAVGFAAWGVIGILSVF
ncbi:MAG: hypothetical protein WA908_09600 [Pontixanthobacter sp.]